VFATTRLFGSRDDFTEMHDEFFKSKKIVGITFVHWISHYVPKLSGVMPGDPDGKSFLEIAFVVVMPWIYDIRVK
jgi:hypothetical protein